MLKTSKVFPRPTQWPTCFKRYSLKCFLLGPQPLSLLYPSPWNAAYSVLPKSESEVAQSCRTLCDPMDCSLPDSSVHGTSQARIQEWVAISFSRASSLTRGSNPCLLRLLHWQAGSLPVVPAGKPRPISESESHSVVSNSFRSHRLYRPWNSLGQNTGVGSLSLLQGIFPTQGSNTGGLPHCRQILYQLSHKGSPSVF